MDEPTMTCGCGHTFPAPDDAADDPVKCPQCGRDVSANQADASGEDGRPIGTLLQRIHDVNIDRTSVEEDDELERDLPFMGLVTDTLSACFPTDTIHFRTWIWVGWWFFAVQAALLAIVCGVVLVAGPGAPLQEPPTRGMISIVDSFNVLLKGIYLLLAVGLAVLTLWRLFLRRLRPLERFSFVVLGAISLVTVWTIVTGHRFDTRITHLEYRFVLFLAAFAAAATFHYSIERRVRSYFPTRAAGE